MRSRIVEALRPDHAAVALLFSDTRPDGAVQFKPGSWGCVMWLLASAAKGRTAVVDRQTFGCLGGGTGLGFGNRYESWPGGIDCFYQFLSSGAGESADIPDDVRDRMRRESLDNLLHGERYIKSPELVKKFVDALPITEVPATYVVFKPLAAVAADERPEIVVFVVDPDRLSALVVLANYGRDSNDNVIIPFAAGCQTIGLLAYRQARSERPRAVVGLTDLSARLYVAKQLGRGLLTFATPMALYDEMEANVEGSFLERPTWQALLGLARG
jgi:uncharacterized protein (DUF169 family)